MASAMFHVVVRHFPYLMGRRGRVETNPRVVRGK